MLWLGMRLAQKTVYAVRAVYELARRQGGEMPVAITAIAQAQHIPSQFLQVIMRELRQGGFVDSRRGKDGGYLLARPAAEVAVGEIVRFFEGDFSPVEGLDAADESAFPAFGQLWRDAQGALGRVFDEVSFATLLERERQRSAAPDYVI